MAAATPTRGARHYVLKLHRDARPECGLFQGRLENLASGAVFDFGSADELVRCLVRDTLATLRAAGIDRVT